ncbi:glycoside hydrolase family 1 protein, partial [Enterococcus faecalis]
QNLMIPVDERMYKYEVAPENAEKIRAQMEYHMFVAHALATNDCHQLVAGGKDGPSVSSTMTYPRSNKPQDVWAPR